MESKIEEGKEKVKNEIKKFFEENKINFTEDKDHLQIKGEIFYIVIVKFTEISIKIGTDKYLVLTFENKTLNIRYEETFPKETKKELKIPKNSINAIYHTSSTLVFLF